LTTATAGYSRFVLPALRDQVKFTEGWSLQARKHAGSIAHDLYGGFVLVSHYHLSMTRKTQRGGPICRSGVTPHADRGSGSGSITQLQNTGHAGGSRLGYSCVR